MDSQISLEGKAVAGLSLPRVRTGRSHFASLPAILFRFAV